MIKLKISKALLCFYKTEFKVLIKCQKIDCFKIIINETIAFIQFNLII